MTTTSDPMKQSKNVTQSYSGTLNIEGMTCASCVGRVEKALQKLPNIDAVSVNLATEKATIQSHESLDYDAIIQTIEKAGYEVPKALPIELAIDGMTCASCVGRVEKALKKVEGVTSVSVNLATEKALIVANPPTTVEQLIQAVAKAGYEAHVIQADQIEIQQEKKADELNHLKHDLILATILATPVFLLEMG